MSLINQALRKAQHDRNPGSAQPETPQDGSAPEHGHTAGMHQPAPHQAPNTGLIISVAAGFALLIGLVIGLAFIVLQKNNSPQQLTTSNQQPATNNQQPQQPTTNNQQPQKPTTTNNQQLTTSQLIPSQQDLLEELRIVRAAAEAKAAEEAATAQAEAKAKKEADTTITVATHSQAIVDWLSEATFSGVRLSSKGNKVLINGKAYKVGEVIHYGLNIRVKVIEENRILITDPMGKTYMKRL